MGLADNSNGGDVVSMAGEAALVYSDIFSSVSDAPQFSFGVFDNLVITVPEPSSVALLSLGGLAMLCRRKVR